LFLGVLATDLAYYATYELQWKNFASWLLVGALVFSGFAAVLAIVDWARPGAGRSARGSLYTILLAVLWVLALFNALVHAADAWGSMPDGLILSAIIAAMALGATWLGFSRTRMVS
jgi:uncharacterized membrane protein